MIELVVDLVVFSGFTFCRNSSKADNPRKCSGATLYIVYGYGTPKLHFGLLEWLLA
jgi:hypothetical protein